MVMLIDELSPVARDILRFLPDMLSGKEPFLESAAARRALREDPGCREVLLAIADAKSTFHSVQRRPFVGGLPRVEVDHIVARVRSEQARALALVFWAEAFDAYLQACAARRRTFVLGEQIQPEQALLEEAALVRSRARNPRDEFELLLGAFDSLRPNDAASRFLRLSMADVNGDPIAENAWLTIGREAKSSHVRGACMFEHANERIARGDLRNALECIRTALRFAPSPEIIFHGTVVCAMMNNEGELSHFVEQLKVAWTPATIEQRNYIRTEFLATPEIWTRPSKKLEFAIDALWSVLGAR